MHYSCVTNIDKLTEQNRLQASSPFGGVARAARKGDTIAKGVIVKVLREDVI